VTRAADSSTPDDAGKGCSPREALALLCPAYGGAETCAALTMTSEDSRAGDAVAAGPQDGAPSVKGDLLLLRGRPQPDGHVVCPAQVQ